MGIGALIRHRLGPLERPATEAYRSLFISIDGLADRVAAWTDAERVLEVGCGEGAVLERLAERYPHAELTGIDIAGDVGRQFRDPPPRVRFRRQAVEELAEEEPASFDLALLVDVLHHVPPAARPALLAATGRALRPGGTLVLKEWERRPTPIHALCWASDRLVTGDRVRYASGAELRRLVESVFGEGAIADVGWIPPWRHNLALLVRPVGPAAAEPAAAPRRGDTG